MPPVLQRGGFDKTIEGNQNTVDKLFENMKTVADNREKARATEAEFTAKIDEMNKDFATNPANNLFFGPDGIPTTPPPAIVAGKQAGLKAKADFEAQMERQKAAATVGGQLDAITQYNKGLTDSSGGPALPNPDDPRLVKAYIGPQGGLAATTMGQAKQDALNEVAKTYPAVKSYQNASPAVESYFKNKGNYKTDTVRQSSLVSTLRSLEASKVDPSNLGAMQSIGQKYDAFMNKIQNGGGLAPAVADDLESQLKSQYDELGGAFNNAIDAAPKFAKVPLGPKGITDVISKHVPMDQRSVPQFKSEAEAVASGVKGKVMIGGKGATIK